MPLHYVITDALVALVAAWGVWHMLQSQKPGAALGLALFGLAGAIGTVRILSGLVEALAVTHKTVSQLGGIAGASLILSEIVRERLWPHRLIISMLAAAVSAGLAVIVPPLGAALFLALLVTSAILLIRAGKDHKPSLFGALGFGLMIINVLLFRQSPILGPDMSWHVYHVIVALWLGLAAVALKARG